jgi:hypothetical protein
VHKGAVDPCKIDAAGAVPALSTISFPSSHLGEGARLLTGVARFETVGGSQFTFDADVFLGAFSSEVDTGSRHLSSLGSVGDRYFSVHTQAS